MAIPKLRTPRFALLVLTLCAIHSSCTINSDTSLPQDKPAATTASSPNQPTSNQPNTASQKTCEPLSAQAIAELSAYNLEPEMLTAVSSLDAAAVRAAPALTPAQQKHSADLIGGLLGTGCTEVLRALLAKGARGDTPSLIAGAAGSRFTEDLRAILESGANPNPPESEQVYHPLHGAAGVPGLPELTLLFKHGLKCPTSAATTDSLNYRTLIGLARKDLSSSADQQTWQYVVDQCAKQSPRSHGLMAAVLVVSSANETRVPNAVNQIKSLRKLGWSPQDTVIWPLESSNFSGKILDLAKQTEAPPEIIKALQE